jgi:hypothetical protein
MQGAHRGNEADSGLFPLVQLLAELIDTGKDFHRFGNKLRGKGRKDNYKNEKNVEKTSPPRVSSVTRAEKFLECPGKRLIFKSEMQPEPGCHHPHRPLPAHQFPTIERPQAVRVGPLKMQP